MQEHTILGVDTGGTFTDFVLHRNGELRLHKVLSTPAAPEEAILQGMRDLGLSPDTPHLRVVHGTTVATNAALERKGVRTAFITNKGFRDLLSIGRQARKELYNLTPDPRTPPVPQEFCLEAHCRRDARGNLIEPLTDQDLETLLSQIEAAEPSAVAICLLFSFLDDSEEVRIQQAIENRFGSDIFVTRSSWVLPEYKEYERGIATWYNAYLGPLVKDYLSGLKSKVAPAPLAIMQSSGSTIEADQAAVRSVNLLLSGPAGGLAAVEHIGELIGSKKLLSFDMGGTSTDVALIDGQLRLTSEGSIGDYPVAVPMVDMHTIGAGGGSIARVDNSGMLLVGPESAGASPGPACYGQGGIHATVTDANAVLGRLQPDNFLGGRMELHLDAAIQAMSDLSRSMAVTLAEAAQGVVDLANEHMLQALRLISEQRGHDPKDYTLCGFGGAGGLHICELADALGIRSAVVPAMGGVLSALGMLVAPAGRELSRAKLGLLEETDQTDLEAVFSELEQTAIEELKAEGHSLDQLVLDRSVDCRYKGQSYSLNLPWNSSSNQIATAFHSAHELAYGHRFDLPIELVNARLSATLAQDKPNFAAASVAADTPERFTRKIWFKDSTGQMVEADIPLVQRESIACNEAFSGPVLVCEEASTTWVASGWEVKTDAWQNLRLSRCSPE